MLRKLSWPLAAAAVALAALVASAPGAQAQTQDTLAQIKSRGKLLAGVKFDTPPFGFLDDKNQPVGFDLDIVRGIAKRIGVPVEFVKVTSPTRITPSSTSMRSPRAPQTQARPMPRATVAAWLVKPPRAVTMPMAACMP